MPSGILFYDDQEAVNFIAGRTGHGHSRVADEHKQRNASAVSHL